MRQSAALRGSELAVLDRLLQPNGRNVAAQRGHHDARGDDRARRRGRADPDADAARGGHIPRELAAIRAAARRGSCAARVDDAGSARAGVRADPNAPCPTCPGGRGEPRGARAFPGVLEAQEPPAPPARAGGPSVTLSREPALVAVAAEKGELGDRAAKVLARIGWPGKAGAAPAAAALSAVDQKRFTAGQEIYKNICEGCHGADGREQAGATPNIAGAPSVIGAPGVPIRVLLHGKEGAIGLMPAHGDLLNDDGYRCGPHLHPPRVGTNGRADRSCGRAAGAHGHRRPHARMDA